MIDKEDRLFDEKLRKALADYEEAVPEDLWEGISSGLDRMERKKRLAGVFWKVAGSAAAVAAAVAAVFVFIGKPVSETEPSIADSQTPVSVVESPASDAKPTFGATESPAPAAESTASDGKTDVNGGGQNITVNPTAQAVPTVSAVSATPGNDEVSVIRNNSTEVLTADNADIVTSIKTSRESDGKDSIAAVGLDDNTTSEEALSNDALADNTSVEDMFADDIFADDMFADGSEKPAKKVRFALAMAGNTSVNTDRSVQSIRRYAPSIGITPTETTLSERTDNVNYSLPVTVGIGVKVFFAKRWAIGTGVNYTLLSKKVKVDYTEVDEESGLVTKDISTTMKNDQHYIGVPLNIYFSIVRNNNWDFYTYIGGSVDKCVANKYRNISSSDPFSYTRKTEGVQPAVNIGIGVEFCPAKNIGIFIDPNLSYFFDCKQPRSIRTIQPLTFSASAGVRFRI